MKQYGFLLGCCFIFNFISAQNPLVKQWDRRFGALSESILFSANPTNDGGCILGGFTVAGIGGDKTQPNWDTANMSRDFWVVKVDSAGNKEWDKRFGGVSWDELYCAKQTTDGGYIFGGRSTSDSSGDKSQDSWGVNGCDYWVVKTDGFGNKQWDRRYGGFNIDWVNRILLTSDGGYLVGGFSISDIGGDKSENDHGGGDYWIVKIDSLGNKLWDKTIGSNQQDDLYTIRQTSNGDYILGGESEGGISGDKTETALYTCYWVVKLNSSGAKIWDKTYDGNRGEKFGDLTLTSDGGFIIAGSSNSDAGIDKTDSSHGGAWDSDYWIVKADSLGVKQWDRSIGAMFSESISGIENNIMQFDDGSYLVTGVSVSEIGGDKSENRFNGGNNWIIKLNPQGYRIWDKTVKVSANSFFTGSFLDANGNLFTVNSNFQDVIGEKSQPPWVIDESDYWVAKYSIKSCNAYFSLNPDTTQHNYFYCQDYSYGEQPLLYHWDWGDGSTDNSAYPSHTYTSAGTYMICLSIEDAGGCTSIYCDSLQQIVVSTNDSVYINTIPSLSTGVEEMKSNTILASIVPNPASTFFHIQTNTSAHLKEVEIYTILGEKIFSKKELSDNHISLEGWKPGIYIVKIKASEGLTVQKLIIQ